jgi:hypothetical protein
MKKTFNRQYYSAFKIGVTECRVQDSPTVFHSECIYGFKFKFHIRIESRDNVQNGVLIC